VNTRIERLDVVMLVGLVAVAIVVALFSAAASIGFAAGALVVGLIAAKAAVARRPATMSHAVITASTIWTTGEDYEKLRPVRPGLRLPRGPHDC